MSPRVVIYHTDKDGRRRAALVLSDVKFNRSKVPILGHVMNGAWEWSWVGKWCRCKSGNQIMHRWLCTAVDFIVVPAGQGGDYHAVLSWADNQPQTLASAGEIKTCSKTAT